MKNRKLRIAWSVAWGVACLLLIALWVRSYSWLDACAGFSHSVAAYHGSLYIDTGWAGHGPVIVRNLGPVDIISDYEAAPTRGDTTIPIWLFLILGLASGIAPWLPWHFSLRTLLIATTLVAILLGLIVYAAS